MRSPARLFARLSILTALALIVPGLYAQPSAIDLKTTLLDVQGAASFDGTAIVAEVGGIVTIRFTVEHAAGTAFLNGDEFNALAGVPVPQSNIFRKQGMSSDSEDVPCSLAGCTGRIDTGETVTFSTTFLAETVGTTTLTIVSSPNLRSDSNAGNNTLELGVEVVEADDPAGDLVLVIEDIQGALSFDSNTKTSRLPMGEEVTIVVRVTNNGPDEATDVVITGGADPDFFVIRAVTLDPGPRTCPFFSADGFFTCSNLTLAAGASANVSVVGVGVAETEETGFSASTGHPDDPDFSNNDDFSSITVEDVEVTTGAIVVIKFEDTNGNRMEDPQEPRLAGWTIYIDTNNNAELDAGEPAAVTDGSGEAVFSDLLPGTYIVREVQQTGFLQTFPAAPPFHEVVLDEDGQVETVKFGNFPFPPSIQGQVFEDANENGMRDSGEVGIDGVTIELYVAETGLLARSTTTMSMDLDGDGEIDPDTERGLYRFADLLPDTYIVVQRESPEFRQTVPLNPDTYTVTVEAGDIIDGLDFGNVAVPVGSIQGQAFFDADSDGVRDGAREVGQNDVIVELIDADGGVVAQRVTMSIDLDGDGSINALVEQGLYAFEGLLPGIYTVRQQVPSGFAQTSPPNGDGHSVTLNAGERVEGRNFGNGPIPASIQGQVFDDLDADGAQDLGEPGKNGVTVQLLQISPIFGVIVDEVETMSRDVDGNGIIDPETEQGLYRFESVPPGTYIVQLASGFGVTSPVPPDEHIIEIGAGEDVDRINFGTTNVGSISGHLFFDRNDDDMLTPPREAGIDGAAIELVRDGVVIATTTTVRMDIIDENGLPLPDGRIDPTFEQGLYWFSRVEPADYQVRARDDPFRDIATPVNVTVAAGQGLEDVDLAFDVQTFVSEPDGPFIASIQGQVFEDINRNGIRDSGEEGIDGETVRLLDAGLLIVSEVTTVSRDVDGNGVIDPESEQGLYGFDELLPDLYFVDLPRPSEQQTLPPPPGQHRVVLTPGLRQEDVNFGIAASSSLYGQKFFDANGDGVRSGAAEVGLNGWVIELVNDEQLVVARDTTHDADLDGDGNIHPVFEQGLYAFEGVPPGSFIVREQVQAGFGFRQTAPSPQGEHRITVEAGQETVNLDFGNTTRAAIRGQKFLDVNNNADYDPDEPGLNDVVIELLDEGGTVVASTRTMSIDVDGDGQIGETEKGQFQFEDVAPGTYIVREVVVAPLVQTFPPGEGTYTAVVDEGQVSDALLFGNASSGGAIHGQKFLDRDGDGQFDIDDPGLDGVLIELVDEEGVVVESTRTMSVDEDGDGQIADTEKGRFSFPQVVPGTYVVREVVALPLVQTFPFGEGTYTVTLDEEQIIDTLLFGNGSLAGVINGQKFLDREGDGRQSPTDPGLDGIVIELLGEDGVVLARTTTMSMDRNGDGRVDPALEQGLFSFDGLNAGTYTVREVVAPPFTRTFPPGEGTHAITLADREVVDIEAVLFGNTRPGAIYGQKFLDRDGDGKRDATDPGFDGMLINLFDASGALVDSMRTMSIDLDGDGEINPISERGLFRFEDLEPGDYQVSEPVPRGFRSTLPPGSTLPPDVVGPLSVSYTVTLLPSDRVDTLLFGNLRTGSIDGQVVEDSNGNSFPEADEPRKDGTTIRVTDQEGLVRAVIETTSRDLNGDGVIDPETERGLFLIDDLEPGVYFVAIQPLSDQRVPFQRPLEVRVGPGERVEGVILLSRRVSTVTVDGVGDEGDGDPGDGVCDTGGGKRSANHCTLRAALEECNARASDAPVCVLVFSGVGKQATTIRPQSPLPPITRPLTMDGGGRLVLDGSEAGAGADGVVLEAGESFVTGLTITAFQRHGLILDGLGENLVEGNTITANSGDGIRVASGAGNTLQANLVFGNGGLPIDLGGDGTTGNDTGDADMGANDLQNAPVLAAYDAEHRTLHGILASTSSLLFEQVSPTFRLEFFSGSTCSSSGSRDAEVFLGAARVLTDLNGEASFSVTFDTDAAVGAYIMATATDPDGNTSETSDCLEALATPLEDPETELPARFHLHANYPNPFNPQTTIRYSLPQTSDVRIAVYNVLGQRVALLVDGEQPAGTHVVVFDASGLASGIYFYNMTAGSFTRTRPMVLLR